MTAPTAVSADTTYLRNKAYLAVALTHFSVDVLNNGRTVLVAVLALVIGLSNSQVGLALILYNVGSALAQPLFGWWADRVGPRWFIVGGMGWMIALYSFAAVGEPWPALVAITLAGFGSGSFHPTGTLVASSASRTSRTQATAFFFMAGQLGLFIGPIVGGQFIDRFGRIGFLILPLFALFALVGSFLHVQPVRRAASAVSATVQVVRRQVSWPTIGALVALMLLISTVSITTINFAPKLFLEQGSSSLYAGIMSGSWMLGSAFGGLAGGWLADRYSNRVALGVGLLGALIPLFFYIPAPYLARIPLLTVAGFFGGMPHSVLVLGVQWLFPARRAMASGLALGLMFMGGAVGSYLVGIVADGIGLAITLQWLALLLLVCLPIVPLLPRRYAEV